jgi:hypothetical protein
MNLPLFDVYGYAVLRSETSDVVTRFRDQSNIRWTILNLAVAQRACNKQRQGQ